MRDDFFKGYKCTQLGNIDFVVATHDTEKGMRSLEDDRHSDPHGGEESMRRRRRDSSAAPQKDSGRLLPQNETELKSLLWAEAKQGTAHDIYESFVQLILTIGKERTFENHLPPKYIGAFDAEKFAFIEYHRMQHVFYQNDFNWNVTPSNHDSKEFRQLHALCESLLQGNAILFRYETQAAELREFIKRNFKTDRDRSKKISVTKNNFTFVFQKWSDAVKPTIGVDWERNG